MTSEVSWQVELAVKPGKLENFRALTREMVESTKDEPGVLLYERFAGDDGKIIYVYERYTDSSSAVSHLLAFGKKYSERFMDMVERKRFMVFGVPSDELNSSSTVSVGMRRLRSNQINGLGVDQRCCSPKCSGKF